MTKFSPYRLRIIIPLLVCVITLMVNAYQTYHRLGDSREIIISNVRETLGYQMNQLQSIISDNLLLGDKDRASRRIANVALDHHVVTLLLADENHSVMLANRQELLTAPAQSVTHYETDAAIKVRSNQSSLMTNLHGRLVSYYPVVLSMQPGELRPQHFGTLYVEYDLTPILKKAEQDAYVDAVKSMIISVLFSLTLLLIIHLLITKRIERLLAVMKEVTAGNLDARSGMRGEGEIAQLGDALDKMTEELSSQQEFLHQQTVELEQEIAERQIAQEGLEEQATLLEEEISERSSIEGKLEETSLFNQQIINSAREGIVVYDRNLLYQVWNPFMEDLTGVPASATVGKHPLEVFPFLKDAGIAERLGKVLAGEKVEDMEFPFVIDQTGKSGWVSDTSAPLLNIKGETIGIIGTVRNITIHRSTEDQLRQAQKMEAIGQLAGGIAHDFNNILTVMSGYGEMLRMDPTLTEPQGEKVNNILAATEKAVHLTRGLLAFSRKQVMDPKILDLNEVVQQVQKFLARIIGEDIHLKTICTALNLKAKVDSSQIEQVLINLATNARDAMPGGGTFTIETGSQFVENHFPDNSEAVHQGSYAYIAVSDSGHGMDKATRKKIFDPFFTTKEVGKGTGLGMAIVHGIVAQHGGFINVYSELGQGTCFKIYIPLVEDALAKVEDASVALPLPKGGHETVLVAEDNVELRELYKSVLSDYGYEVVLAEDGQDAVEKFAANRDRIKLLILDIIMPFKSGIEANAEIRKLKPDGVRTLYSSGYTRDFILNRGELTDMEDLIMKPVRPLELLRKVREILDR